MKIFMFILVIIFSNLGYSQVTKTEFNLYSITIFKWTKDSEGKENRTIVMIDEDGNVS